MQGKTWYLYLGRGHGKEGVWISEKKPESFLRKRDRYLEYLRKHLESSQFKQLILDDQDRIISLEYFKWGHINKFFIFYNARNLYFCHHYFDPNSHLFKCFKSWTMKGEFLDRCDFDIFDEIGRTNLNKDVMDLEIISISKLLGDEKKQAMSLVNGHGGKSQKFLKRKKKRILDDLSSVQNISGLQKLAENEAELVNLPTKNNLNGVRLKFQYQDFYKRRDEVYTKIKKLKKAKSILDLRLKDTEVALKGIKDIQVENKLKIIPVLWKKQENKIKESKVSEKFYKIIDLGTIAIGIGLTAVGNDQLRSEWANKSDIWFHLDGDKSAHIIIKLRDKNLTTEIFEIAASALVEFGQTSYESVNILYTQVKNLKGVKGAPGKVTYKKEKRIQVDVNKHWRDISL